MAGPVQVEPQGREDGRWAGHAVNQVRTRHQSADRPIARPYRDANATRPRRRGDRISSPEGIRKRFEILHNRTAVLGIVPETFGLLPIGSPLWQSCREAVWPARGRQAAPEWIWSASWQRSASSSLRGARFMMSSPLAAIQKHQRANFATSLSLPLCLSCIR
jgi:hypothetical protein